MPCCAATASASRSPISASRNGTYHNGQRLGSEPATLAAGDVVKVGDFTLVFDTGEVSRFDEASAAAMRPVLQKAPHELLLSNTPPAPGDRELSPEGLRFELDKKTRVLGLFYELSRTLGSVFSLDDVYDKAMGLLLQVTPAARVIIYQRGEGAELQQVAARARGAGGTAWPRPRPSPSR